MPTEWQRQSWGAPGSGWPTFGEDGRVIEPDDEDDEEEADG